MPLFVEQMKSVAGRDSGPCPSHELIFRLLIVIVALKIVFLHIVLLCLLFHTQGGVSLLDNIVRALLVTLIRSSFFHEAFLFALLVLLRLGVVVLR